jgi:hypothetical protein
MGQEYFINSQQLQDKVANLLPSQGGAGSSVDLSASTQIVPIIDLTESAEGSNVRADIQTALSLNNITNFEVQASSGQVLVNNTGYFRVFGRATSKDATNYNLSLDDGVTGKIIFGVFSGAGDEFIVNDFDFVVFIAAGQSLLGTSSNSSSVLSGCTRQIADIDGNLINP